MKSIQIHFTKFRRVLAIAFVVFAISGVGYFQQAQAAAGINPQINFQGKVVNKTAGTNVTNGNYDFSFKLYDAASSGTLLWTENWTGGNQVTVTDGIFRVALGSITSLSSVDFNSDSLYLDITFNGESMGTRIRFSSVPYAFNAQKVNGLSVTNNGGNTLNIAASKTFTVSNSLTLTGTDSTSFAFPSTGGGTVLVTNISGQNIAGSLGLTGASGNLTLAGTTGLTFSGTGGDITFTNGEKIDNDVDGTIAVTGDLDASGAFNAGTGNAFAVNSLGAITAATGITLTSGAITLGASTGSGQCLTGGATASWGSCGASGTNYWNFSSGAYSPINGTGDLLLGFGASSPATSSARFSVLNMTGTNTTPTASISANSGNNATFLTGAGVLGTTNRQTLTIGSPTTTGDIQMTPGTTGAIGNRVFINGGSGSGGSSVGGDVTIAGGSVTGGGIGGGNVYIKGGEGFSNSGYVYIDPGSKQDNEGNVNICTLQDCLTVNVGNGNENVVIDSSNWDVSSAGVGSGFTGFASTGTIAFSGAGNFSVDSSAFDVTTGGAVSGVSTLNASGAITFSTFTTAGGLLYTNGSGLLTQLTSQGSSGDCLKSTGAGTAPAFSACGGGTNYWNFGTAAGAYSPINGTGDLLLGFGSSVPATSSARFSVLNMTGTNTTAVASVSAQNAGGQALTLAGDGTIQSTRNNTLTIGGSTTGNILLMPNNNSGGGFVGIGTTTPTNRFEVQQTKTDTSGFTQMVFNRVTADPASASTATFVGGYNEARVNTGNSQSFSTASLIGLYNMAQHRGTNTLTNAYGVQGIVKTDNTGTITNARAFYSLGQMTTAAGTMTNYTGYYAGVPTISGGGSIGSAYGVYVENQNIGTAAYGVYVAGATTYSIWVDSGTSRFDGTIDAQSDISDSTGNLSLNDSVDISGLLTVGTGLTLTAGPITVGASTGSGQCLIGGASASWGACGTGLGTNWWTTSADGKAITPINSTLDFLLGSQATTSAKFAVLGLNNARGLQTASISGSISLDSSTASIQTTNGQTLSLGGASTGNIQVLSKAGTAFTTFDTVNSRLGLGTAAPNTKLEIVDTSGNNFIRLTPSGADSSANSAYLSANLSRGVFGYDGVRGAAYIGTQVGGKDIVFDTISPATSLASEVLRIKDNGRLGLGTTAPISELHVTRPLSFGATGKALAVFDQIENQDILTASKSGTTMMVLDQLGNLGLGTRTLPSTFIIDANRSINDDVTVGIINPLEGSSARAVLRLGLSETGDDAFTLSYNNQTQSGGLFRTARSAVLYTRPSMNGGLILATGNSTAPIIFGTDPTGNGDGSILERMRLTSNGKFGFGTTTPVASFDIRNTSVALSNAGTIAVASVSGSTLHSALVVDQTGLGNIFSASTSGVTKFLIQNDGTLLSSKYTAQNGVLFGTQTTGVFAQATTASTGLCLLSGASSPTWSTCPGGGGGTNYWNLANGTLSPINDTLDFLIGGQATASAKFAFTGLSSLNNQTQASISGQLIVMPNNGYSGRLGIGTTAPSQLLDIANGKAVLSGSLTTATANSGLFEVTNTITNNTGAGISSIRARNTFNGNGNIPTGIDIVPIFAPSSSIALARGGVIGAFFAPPVGVTITDAKSLDLVNVYSNVSGAVTTGTTLAIDAPIISGALKPTTQYGIHIENQGASGMATAYGLYVDAQSGATANYAAIFAGGSVGIGTTTPEAALHILGTVDPTKILLDSVGAVASNITGRRANGTVGSKTGVVANDNLMVLGGQGYTSAGAYVTTYPATINLQASETWSGTATGSQILFSTTANNTVSPFERMRLSNNGVLGLGTTSPLSQLHVTRPLSFGATGKALAIFDQIEDQDFFTASKSGTTYFTLSSAGRITMRGTSDAMSSVRYGNDSAGNRIYLAKNRGSVVGVDAIVNSGDALGNLSFLGWDGSTANLNAGDISAEVDGTPGTGDMPGRLVFKTTLDGAGTPTERLRIDNQGKFGINTASQINTSITSTFDIRQNPTSGGTTSVASVAGTTSFAALVANNSGRGDIFTASAAGATRFRIANNGSALFQGDTIASIGTINGTPGLTVDYATINAIGDQGSLVPNSGFESNLTGATFSDGWITTATSTATITRDTASSAKGTASLKVTATGSNQFASVYSTCVPLGGAGSYNLYYYFKSNAANSATVRANIDQYTSKANCQSNASLISSAVASTNSSAVSYQSVGNSSAYTGSSNGWSTTTTWGRVHIYVAITTNGNNANIDGIRLVQSSTQVGVDYAEDYQGDPSNVARSSDVVKLKVVDGKTLVVPADQANDKSVIGVVSTSPGLILNDGEDYDPRIPVALSGRVPVKVSTKNGPIEVGDELTSSDIPGVAVKAISSGHIIGTAMEIYDDPNQNNVGKVTIFVNNSFSFGSFQTNESSSSSQDILASLNKKLDARNTADLSTLTMDQIIAGVRIVAPEITVDNLFAKNIKAEHIDGLDLITDRISLLDAKVASLSASMNLTATSSADTSKIKLLESINEKLLASSNSATVPSNNSVLKDLNIKGLMVFEDSIRVKNNGLFEGMLTVVDTVTTNNFIANGLSTFFGKSVFKDDAQFEKQVTFSNDIGGQALIKKDANKVDIEFDKDFEQTPVINASVSFDEEKDADGNVKDNQALINNYFNEKYAFVIVGKSKKGFTIVLNKKAVDEVNFTWTALRVKDAKTVQSKNPN